MRILTSAILMLFSISAFAGAGSVNVMKCTDIIGRVLTIDQVTGLTGGVPGSYLANVTKDAKASSFPDYIRKVTPDSGRSSL
ncbi:MAG: hypothetical protein ACXVA9_08755 [Bdellovibrionales bacterium]